MDVVQSVWTDVLQGFREKEREFADRAHLRAFLARVTYNHFVNHCRRHSSELEHEQPLSTRMDRLWLASSDQPRPSQVVQADELWSDLLEMCPPSHREVLELKRQGLPLAEIAGRTGLHEGSVRRLLYDLAKRVAARSLKRLESARAGARWDRWPCSLATWNRSRKCGWRFSSCAAAATVGLGASGSVRLAGDAAGR